jgi:fumarate reductase subunit C
VSARSQLRLWIAQRVSAMVLAGCVLVHLLTLIYAVRGGLSAGEILGRTQGSLVWAFFYVLFVLSVAIHAPIGLRTICTEWLAWRGRSLDLAAIAFGLALLGLGLRAVWAVIR